MKRFSFALKFVALMLAVFSAGSSLAQLAPVPVAASARTAAPRPKSVMHTAWDVQGHIYAVVPNFNGMMSYGDAYYGTLDVNEAILSPVVRNAEMTNKDEAYLQSGFVREDILYIPQMLTNMVTMEATYIWKRIDLNTNKNLPNLVFGNDDDAVYAFTYGLTYDPDKDVAYGLAYNNATGAGGLLVKIDCSKPVEEWKPEFLFNVGSKVDDWMAGICYNPADKKLYGLKSQGALYEIDLNRQQVVKLREYDDECAYPPVLQSCPMVYSPKDKAIVYIYGSENGFYGTCTIDMDPDADFDLQYMQDLYPLAQIGTLYCADPYGVDEGPDVMAAPELNFVANSLTGTYSFTAPQFYYNGEKMDKNMVLHVLADGVEVFSKEVTPGETVTNEIELPQGLHFISGYCSLGDINGPSIRKRIYVGNDQPYAPTNLKYVGGVLSWTTPRNIGVNNAYVDLSHVTYNVFLDGEKVNAEPISGNSYEFTVNDPADGRRYITVTATANGVESDPSAALSRVLGKGYNLPLTIAPTAAEATLFETYNANKDAEEWTYDAREGEFIVHMQTYTDKPDDWLFLPPMYFDSADQVYKLVVNYVNARRNNIQKDNLDIFIGKDPVPEAMSKLIYSHTNRIQSSPTDLEVVFNIDEPGTYFIAFHSKPGEENLFRGISLKNFRVSAGNGTTNAPGLVTDVKLTPADLGELYVTVEGKLPTVNMKGDLLDENEEIAVEVSCSADGMISDKQVINGKPGKPFSTTLSSDVDGYADIFLTPSNKEGSGIKQYFTVYTGLDNPLPPVVKKYTIGPDNLSLTMEWEPVGNVGEHGGYVNTDNVVYDIYSHTTTETYKIGTAGQNLTYTHKCQNIPQLYYNIGPVAVNEMGISTNGIFVYEQLGRLYNTPMNEEYGYSAFTYQKWMYNTVAPFNNVIWEHCTDPDEDLGMHITFGKGGAFRALNQGAGTNYGELKAPRVSTKNDDKVSMTLRYWAYQNAGEIEIWGKTYNNQDFRKVATLDPERLSKGEWRDWTVMLPDDFSRQEWIQLNVRVKLSGSQKVIIDTYKISQEIDNDFQLTSLTAPYSALVGSSAEFNIVVTNTGAESGSGKLTLELLAYDIPLDTQVIDIERVRPGENFEYNASFPMKEDYYIYDRIELRATAEAEDDQNPRNNEQNIDFLLYDSPVPVVRDLTAARSTTDEDRIELNWSVPEGTPVFPESMEIYGPLENTETIGPWTNVDIDGKAPFVISQRRWNGDDKPAAWTVFNAQEMNTMNDERLSPRTGEQMLIARSIAYDQSTEKPTRAMDFLISPEVKGGTKVGFWINTFDSQYAETVAIWYSTTDKELDASEVVLNDRDVVPRKCGSFQWLANFTKSGSETWEYCETVLPEDAKYFAFVYSSYGMFGAMIDDITYTPVDPGKINVDGFDVFVTYDNENLKSVASGLTTPAYVHNSTDGRAATYYVVSNIQDGDKTFSSALSNPAKVDASSGVEGISSGLSVIGNKGEIIVNGGAGKAFQLYDTAGKTIVNTVLSADRQSFAVTPGVYVAKVGDKIFKIAVR